MSVEIKAFFLILNQYISSVFESDLYVEDTFDLPLIHSAEQIFRKKKGF